MVILNLKYAAISIQKHTPQCGTYQPSCFEKNAISVNCKNIDLPFHNVMPIDWTSIMKDYVFVYRNLNNQFISWCINQFINYMTTQISTNFFYSFFLKMIKLFRWCEHTECQLIVLQQYCLPLVSISLQTFQKILVVVSLSQQLLKFDLLSISF